MSLINESNKWHDLSAAIESGYNPSSANTAMFVADLCTPSIYLAYFICTLLGIKESYFNSTLTFPFITVNKPHYNIKGLAAHRH